MCAFEQWFKKKTQNLICFLVKRKTLKFDVGAGKRAQCIRVHALQHKYPSSSPQAST